jgi:hypothetical protein
MAQADMRRQRLIPAFARKIDREIERKVIGFGGGGCDALPIFDMAAGLGRPRQIDQRSDPGAVEGGARRFRGRRDLPSKPNAEARARTDPLGRR